MKPFISEFIYGGMDGIITTIAIISSVMGANISTQYALVLGMANVLSDGFSMGISRFNSLVDLQKGNKYYPYYSAFFTFVFFVIMGSIPLIPFLFVSLQNETMMQNMLLCFGLLAFVIIGTIKGIYTKKIVKSLIEVILIGSLGAFIAFYVSKTMKERYLLN